MRGIYFSLDALLALSIFLIGASAIFFYSYAQPSAKPIAQINLAQDVLNALSNAKMKDFENNSCFSNLSEELRKKISPSNSVLEQLLVFWNANYTKEASNITECLFKNLMPENVGYEFIFRGTERSDVILRKEPPSYQNVFVSKRVVSGIDNYPTPMKGFTARVFLTKIAAKETCSYLYFPGFLGQGNFARYFYLPNFSKVKKVYLELDTSGLPFKVCVNNLGNCSSYLQEPDPSEAMKPYSWNLSSLASSFVPGKNILYFLFNNSTSYTQRWFAGGYLEVCYETDSFSRERKNLTSPFFGIYGMINLYDGFYIPGRLKNLSIYLHYDLPIENSTLYLKIGNSTVYQSDSTGTNISVFLNSSELSTRLNFSEISLKTIPLRLGTIANEIKEVSGYGNADVILITDLSGSMKWRLDSDEDGEERKCCNGNSCSSEEELVKWMENDSNVIYDPSTSRISLAKCLDKYFVYKILNLTGNRVGLVGFYGDPFYPYKGRTTAHELSTNRESLYTEIENYYPRGGTCICCAINRAYNILKEQSNSSRKKYIVVMSDGIPTHQCGSSGVDECKGTRDGSPGNPGLWLGFGSGCYGGSDDCDTDDCECAMENANWSSCRVHNDLNATVFSIGFGPVASCYSANWTLRAIANCGNGSYYASQEGTKLKEIYKNISEQINKISYVNETQILNITFIPNATLYEDSYIYFEFEPEVFVEPYSYISVRLSSPRFGGNVTSPKNFTFFLANSTLISNAVVTSYSSAYWTSFLSVNNQSAFLLSSYGDDFRTLGDPFIVYAPSNYFNYGNNLIQIDTAIGPDKNDTTGGSPWDRLIYTLSVPASIEYTKTFLKAEGSTITVYYDLDHDSVQDGNDTIAIGDNSSDVFDPEQDAIDYAFCKLLDLLNFIADKNEKENCNLSNMERDGGQSNPIDIRINSPGIRLNIIEIQGLPMLVGPAVAEIRIYS